MGFRLYRRSVAAQCYYGIIYDRAELLFEEMDEILEGTVLTNRLLERYSKSPKGWNFTIAPHPRDGFFDGLLSNPEESWQIKIDSIFRPTPLMLGAKVDVDYSKVKKLSPVSYGYRRIDPEAIMKVLSIFEDQEDRVSAQTSSKRKTKFSLDSILGPLEPVAPKLGGSYAEGPFVFTNEKISNLSTGQAQLDNKLSSELRRLLRNRYSSYG